MKGYSFVCYVQTTEGESFLAPGIKCSKDRPPEKYGKSIKKIYVERSTPCMKGNTPPHILTSEETDELIKSNRAKTKVGEPV